MYAQARRDRFRQSGSATSHMELFSRESPVLAVVVSVGELSMFGYVLFWQSSSGEARRVQNGLVMFSQSSSAARGMPSHALSRRASRVAAS